MMVNSFLSCQSVFVSLIYRTPTNELKRHRRKEFSFLPLTPSNITLEIGYFNEPSKIMTKMLFTSRDDLKGTRVVTVFGLPNEELPNEVNLYSNLPLCYSVKFHSFLHRGPPHF